RPFRDHCRTCRTRCLLARNSPRCMGGLSAAVRLHMGKAASTGRVRIPDGARLARGGTETGSVTRRRGTDSASPSRPTASAAVYPLRAVSLACRSGLLRPVPNTRLPPHAQPPLPAGSRYDEIEREAVGGRSELPGIDLNEKEQLRLLSLFSSTLRS